MGKFGDTVPAKQSKREIFYKALKFFLHNLMQYNLWRKKNIINTLDIHIFIKVRMWISDHKSRSGSAFRDPPSKM